jgi:predicted amidohydrolase YtcJ
MTAADLVILGTVLTVDDARPTAEALAVAGGRIVAVGNRADVAGWIGSGTDTVELGDGCVMPGLIEAHGHPLMEAIMLSDRMVDIRPVTMRNPDDVVDAMTREVAKRGPDGAYLNGWDALLQNGLPEPTLAWLNGVAPDSPLVIVRGGRAGRADPRHPGPQGRQVRSRRQRRPRRHRRGDRGGVRHVGRRHRTE